MLYRGGKQGVRWCLAILRSSNITIRITSRCLTNHIFPSSRDSSWLPSIFSSTAFCSFAIQIYKMPEFEYSRFPFIYTSLQRLGLSGGRKPVCFCFDTQSSSHFSSLSMILNALTYTVESYINLRLRLGDWGNSPALEGSS